MSGANLVTAVLATALLTVVTLAEAALPDPCAARFEQTVRRSGVAANGVLARLNEEKESGCILGAADSTAVNDLDQRLRRAQVEAEQAVLRTQLFAAMLQEFEGLPSRTCDAPDDTACIVGRHTSKLRELEALLDRGSPNRADPMLLPESWAPQVFNGLIPISQIPLQRYFIQECTAGVDTPRCAGAFELGAKLLRTGLTTLEVVTAHQKPIIEANERFLSQRDREWDSYFNDVSVQYPWELYWNGKDFRDAHPEDLQFFPRAPERKWIALHPSAGLERIEAGGESSTPAALVLEVIGFERWQWQAGEASNRWGASLVASFVDAAGVDSVGYGVLFRTPLRNVSLGAVWRDGDGGEEINLLLNVDLSQLIQEYQQLDLKKFLSGGS